VDRTSRLLEVRQQVLYQRAEFGVPLPHAVDLLDRMDDGGVVLAAERLADFRVARRASTPCTCIATWRGQGDGCGVVARLQLVRAELVIVGHELLDDIDGDDALVVGQALPGRAGPGQVYLGPVIDA
jgi:hypothetical protein